MLQEDLTFLQVVSTVTSRFKAVIDEIDIEKRTVSITCPGGSAQEIECALAIGKILNKDKSGDPGDDFFCMI